MDATLVLIDSDSELARARGLVDRLWESDKPADIARLQAQARLIAAYEESKWPRTPPSTADLIRHLMDQHGRGHEIDRCVRQARGPAISGSAPSPEVTTMIPGPPEPPVPEQVGPLSEHPPEPPAP